MALNRSFVFIVLLLLIWSTWGKVELSNNNIEYGKPWESTLTVTKSNGEPFQNCRVYMSAMEMRGGIETTTSRYSYFTDSEGKAVLSYTSRTPGEVIKISVSCGENKAQYTLTVTGVGEPNIPSINLQIPSIETGQIAAVAFILFAIVFIAKGKAIMDFVKRASSKTNESKKQEIEELEMSPRRLILEHERKVAAKLAKKHMRKEIRLNHEFIRKL